MKKKIQKRMMGCDFCVLVKGYESAFFEKRNNKTICNFCENFREQEPLGVDQLIKKLSLKAKEKIGVTVSGGMDSLHVWAYMVKLFGYERVVAFNHYKMGLVHPIALENLMTAEKILSSKLIQINDHKFFHRFKKNIFALLKKPDPAVVRVVLCAGCRTGISQEIFSEANRLGITKIVNGQTRIDFAPFKDALLVKKGEGNKIKGLMKCLYENTKYYHGDNLIKIMQDEENYHWGKIGRSKNRDLLKQVIYIDFYRYIKYVPSNVEATVKNELNWKSPTGNNWHFDCLVVPVKNYIYYGLLGYTELESKLSQLIRSGFMSKEFAAEELQRKRNKIIESKEYLFSFFHGIKCEKLIYNLEYFCKKSPYLY